MSEVFDGEVLLVGHSSSANIVGWRGSQFWWHAPARAHRLGYKKITGGHAKAGEASDHSLHPGKDEDGLGETGC